jgi:uncharacterized BrkB/YihY/UPF0761 family membrane protein
MNKSKLFISYFLTIGTLFIFLSVIMLIVTWIIQNTSNFLLSHFESSIQLQFMHVFISMILLTSVAVAYSLISERKNKNTIQSKASKYEEDLRWFNDYVGKDYRKRS